ncbi:HET-domain-containing protein [Astrocystis sublimbata]|nr:HET-domain-containing protein [Astrocystis sublimbata]
MAESDDETVALKRQLVAGEYATAHSCIHCKRFVVPTTLPPDDKYERFFQSATSVAEIDRLASLGCRWFSLFSELMHGYCGSSRHELKVISSSVYPTALERGSAIITMHYDTHSRVLIVTANLRIGYKEYHIESYALKQPDASTYPLSRSLGTPINTAPASDKSIELIRYWLKTCSDKHNCGIQDVPPSLPSFLLAIGDDHVHLMDTTGKPKDRYIALSYCWGTRGQRTLLSSTNKKQLLEGIAPEELDTTIQEAICVTKLIGFHYLWIDALCIVQDDEAMRFFEIRDTAGGAYAQLIFEVPYLNNVSDDSSRTVVLVPKELVSRRWMYGKPEEWHLRAWTLQEGIISPRCLQFGTEQTTWTCHHGTMQYRDSDGWVTGRNAETDASAVLTRERHRAQIRDQASQIIWRGRWHDQPDRVWSTWCSIVTEFSGRKIRKQDDRLPAISSVAKGLSKAINDDYICGLWKSQLHRQLLWHWDTRPMRSEEVSGFQPSWSWASSRDGVSLLNESVLKDSDFELLHYNVEPKQAGDIYGAVKSASLRLRALKLSLPEEIINYHRADLIGLSTLAQSTRDYRIRTDHGGMFGDEQYLLFKNKRDRDRKASYMNDLISAIIVTAMKIDKYVGVSRDELNDMSLLIVGHHRNSDTSLEGPVGVVIKLQEDGTYCRIGYFRTRNVWGRSRFVDSDEESSSEESQPEESPSEGDYLSRVRYLWGGKASVCEITLC